MLKGCWFSRMGNLFDLNELVKSLKSAFFVIPADPGSKPALDVIQSPGGIQYFQRVTRKLDPVFQRGDDFLRNHQLLSSTKSPSSL
jgi:hypothetical protein